MQTHYEILSKPVRLDDRASPGRGLAETALASLQATFRTRGHRPGAAHVDALRHLLQTMEDMADGVAERNVFLASLCPGIGKSSSVVAFAAALVASVEHRDAGMLVCVGRIDEAKALAGEMAAAGIRQHVAVLTSDETANALSGAAAPHAQVLIVTQQMVERRTKQQPFGGVSMFHFEGSARAVRVWDEAWLPGAPITLDRTQLGALFSAAQQLSRPLSEALEEMFIALKDVPDGGLYAVPDWTAISDVTETDLLEAVKWTAGMYGEQQRLTASALFVIAGREIRVRREVYAAEDAGRVLISYQDTLPDDLAPLLVLDASIRVRQTYQDAVEYRRVKMLPEAVKDYSPLTVHLWKTGGGKTAFGRNSAELVQGMANTVMTKPDEDWLIITHRQGGKVGNVEAQLRRLLPPGVSARVSVLTWGRHMATNAFRDCPNVILGGTLFMPTPHYLALTHLSQDRRPEVHGFVDPAAVVKTTHGEHRNLILQAACRGRVRQSDGDRCLPMDLYIIAAANSAIPTTENVGIIFPGAAIKRWAPVSPKLVGKAADAAVVLSRLLEGGALSSPDAFLGYGAIAKLMPGRGGAVRPMTSGNFRSRVADSNSWKDHLVSLGLVESAQSLGRGGATRGLRLAVTDEAPDWVDSFTD